MADINTRYHSPGTTATADRDGKVAWTDTDNVKVNNEDFAECIIPVDDYGDWLRITNFGFTLPTDAVILGIEVMIIRDASGADDIFDSSVRLRKTSGQVGDDGADPEIDWQVGPGHNTEYYGGLADDWNAGLTRADVISSDFGIDISAQNKVPGVTEEAEVYYVEMRVAYSTSKVTAWKGPGTAANVDRDGESAWDDLNNILVDDGNFSENDVSKNSYSDWLTATNFSFAGDIPVGATIDGIEVLIRHKAQTDEVITDDAFYLLDGEGAQQGDNKSSAVLWKELAMETWYYGDPLDTWNAGLDRADFIDADFGLRLSVYDDHISSSRARVMYVAVRVFFTSAGETPGPYKLAYRKSAATVEITTYEAAGGLWNESFAIRVNATTYYAQCDSNLSHAKASDLRVRIGGVTYAVLTEEGVPS